MEKAKQIVDIVFRCISKLSDEEIGYLINKEAKLVYVDIKKVNDVKKSCENDILDICKVLDNVNSREKAYNLLGNNIKKDMLFSIAKYFDVHVLKSYTKLKIIDSIVEGVVGNRIDKNAIESIDIK